MSLVQVLRRRPSNAITPTGVPSFPSNADGSSTSSSGFNNGYPFPQPPNPHPTLFHPQSAPTPPPFQLPAHTIPQPYSPYLTGQGPLDAMFGSPAAFHHPHLQHLHPQPYSLPSPQNQQASQMYQQSGGAAADIQQMMFGMMDGVGGMDGYDLSSLLEFDGGGSYML